jgi:hypothetical protein
MVAVLREGGEGTPSSNLSAFFLTLWRKSALSKHTIGLANTKDTRTLLSLSLSSCTRQKPQRERVTTHQQSTLCTHTHPVEEQPFARELGTARCVPPPPPRDRTAVHCATRATS